MATPIRMRKAMPTAGLRSAWPAQGLEETQTPRCLNVRFRFGEVRPAPGRALVAGPMAGEAVQWIGRYPRIDGTEWTTALTPGGLFRWGDGAPGTPRQWHRALGAAFGGTADRWAVAVGEDRIFWSRRNEPIRFWDGDPTHAIATTGGSPPSAARYLEYFNNRLVAGWTLESGTEYANRLRWAVNGNSGDWTGTGSGFLDLYDSRQEPLYGIRALGDRLVCYQEHHLTDLVPTGTATPPVHTAEVRVRGMGTMAPWTIASTGQVHFFLGSDRNVYGWDGTSLHPVGDPILEELRGVASPDRMGTYLGAVSTQRQEYWLIFGGTDAFIYDYARNAWARDSFPNLTAIAEVIDTTGAELWNTVTSTWETERRTWDEMAGTSTIALWAGRADGATFSIDEQVGGDYFAADGGIEHYIETPDFHALRPVGQNLAPDPMAQITINRLLIEYAYTNAQPFDVAMSVDRGQTWQTKTIVPNRDGYTLLFFSEPITGNVVRFRFRERDAESRFRWQYYTFEFLEAGPYERNTA